MTLKKIRKNGDNTRLKIMNVARKLFAKQGFGETTIEQIVNKANVNHSLVFHHFQNKENLWKAVKQSFLFGPKEFNYEKIETLEEFLNTIILDRFNLYIKNQEYIRMMLWQLLEPTHRQLFGGNKLSPEIWVDVIKKLQFNQQISQALKPEHIIIMITGMVDSIAQNGTKFLLTIEDQNLYLKFIINSLKITLTVQQNNTN